MSHKADVNMSPKSGLTPLHEAVERRHVNLVAFLLQNGSDIYARDERKRTPLGIAEASVSGSARNKAAKSSNSDIILAMILQIQRGDY